MSEKEPSPFIPPSSPKVSRSERAEKLTTFLTASKAEQVFGSDETKKEYIRDVSFDKFKSLLVRINGILRDRPIRDRSIDGENVVIENRILGEEISPPYYVDKEGLLQEMLERAKKLENMDDIALLAATTINAVHPFLDGNGRTSRTVYLLLRDDYNGTAEDKQRLQEVLGEEGRLKVDPNPSLLEEFAVAELQKELGLNPTTPTGAVGFAKLDHCSEENKRNFEKIMRDDSVKFLTLYKYLTESGQFKDEYVRKVYSDNGDLEGMGIEISVLTPNLTDRDIQEILETYQAIKRYTVEKIMDIITQPEQYPHPDGGTVKQWFEEEITKEKY